MSDTADTADTLDYRVVLHQDMIDDCMVNPVPAAVADMVAKVYAEAEQLGATVVQWRMTFTPWPATGMEEFGSPEDVAYLAGRRVIKMVAYTTGGTEPTA